MTDRRTDGQNCDSQDRASIAASRGKNRYTLKKRSGRECVESVLKVEKSLWWEGCVKQLPGLLGFNHSGIKGKKTRTVFETMNACFSL